MKKILSRAARRLLRHSQWIPVVGAVVYVVLWGIAEAGRMQPGDGAVLALFTIAIALSGIVPLASLSIVTVVPILQLAEVLSPPTADNWPFYQAAGWVALVVAFRGEGLARKLVLPVGIVTAILFATRMMIPDGEHGGWTTWVAGAPSITDYPNREGFATLLLLALGFYVGLWVLGIAGRSLLRERAIGRALTRTDFDLRIAEDRARISRDVHDALAHSLAVIVSQAEGALALQARRPAVAVDALTNIASVGRVALTDVRSLVESIHDEDLTAVAPSVDDLPSVIARMRKVGMDATLQVLGEPQALPPSRDLAVFRIVQESLTNALKHGGPTSTARVTLDWQGTGLAVLVVSSPNGDPAALASSRGVGIAGMKERARLAGGWLTAEPEADDFIVTAFIPISEHEPTGELAHA
jgi:signal transduction histidine kinase